MTVSERYKERYEIINGETVMMTPPAMVHQDVSSNIVSIFKIYLKGKVCRAYGDNTLVKLDDENQFMPDAMIVCDWSKINKNDYLQAMQASVINPSPIRSLLVSALTDKINDRETFMKGIDYSYYYEQED